MFISFEAVTAEIKRRADLRCSYCGASLLFGRHKSRAPFIAARAAVSLGQARRLLIPTEQMPARLMDALLAFSTVALGYLMMTSGFLPSAGSRPLSAELRESNKPPATEAAIADQSPFYSNVLLTGLSFTPTGKLSRRFETLRAQAEFTAWLQEPTSVTLGTGESFEAPAAPSLSAANDASLDTDMTVTGSVKQLAGMWGPDVSACRSTTSKRSGFLPMVIASNKARAGEATCWFRDVQQSGSQWAVIAQCAAGKKRWTSRVKLVLSGSRLSWRSGRGTQDYVRCGGFAVAER